jgi:hypothetical protein
MRAPFSIRCSGGSTVQQQSLHRNQRRGTTVQQLSFLEPPASKDAAAPPPVLNALDGDQHAKLVLRLARLIVRTLDPTATAGEQTDERDE